MSDLYLGEEHYLRYYSWNPDRHLNPQYENTPDIDKCGAIIGHLTPKGEMCTGSIMFEGTTQEEVFPTRIKWKVEKWEPLTLSPSILCSCGDHGFITEGRWVKV